MSSKLALKILGGAAALAMSAGAFAATSDGTTAFLLVTDTTTGAQYLYDTGIASTAFISGTTATNPLSSPINLSADANFTAFKTAAGTDVVSWSVLSVAVPGFNGGQGTTLLTSPAALAPGNGAVTGATVFDAVGQVATFIAGAPQTTGASTFYTASVVAGDTTSGFAKNYGANFNSDFNISTPGATLGATANTLKFYALTSTDTAGSSNASVAYNTLGTWSFSTAGLLSYATSAVPLPAPLALLLSGLGLLGFVARRKTSASADVFAGAAA